MPVGTVREVGAGPCVRRPPVRRRRWKSPAPRGLDLTPRSGKRGDSATWARSPSTCPTTRSRARGRARSRSACSSSSRDRSRRCLHYSCRDRSLIGMQSDLVGAHAMGLRNVLLTTGTPAPHASQASYADATSVFDVDAIGLIEHGRAAQPRARYRGSVDRRPDAASTSASRSIRLRPIPTPSGDASSTRSRRAPSFS